MIGAGNLAKDKDRFRAIEVFERDCSLPDSDRLAQRSATRFVTHVRTIRQVIRAKLSHEQLIQKRRFITRAARSVEDRLVGIIQGVELGGNHFKRIVSTDALVVRRVTSQAHRTEERRVGKECRSRWSPY